MKTQIIITPFGNMLIISGDNEYDIDVEIIESWELGQLLGGN